MDPYAPLSREEWQSRVSSQMDSPSGLTIRPNESVTARIAYSLMPPDRSLMPSGCASRYGLISHNHRARPFRRPSQYLVEHGDRTTVHPTLHEPLTGNDQRTGPLTPGETIPAEPLDVDEIQPVITDSAAYQCAILAGGESLELKATEFSDDPAAASRSPGPGCRNSPGTNAPVLALTSASQADHLHQHAGSATPLPPMAMCGHGRTCRARWTRRRRQRR
jgi:hypothetical protein